MVYINHSKQHSVLDTSIVHPITGKWPLPHQMQHFLPSPESWVPISPEFSLGRPFTVNLLIRLWPHYNWHTSVVSISLLSISKTRVEFRFSQFSSTTKLSVVFEFLMFCSRTWSNHWDPSKKVLSVKVIGFDFYGTQRSSNLQWKLAFPV